jgi:glutamate synthase (NADPH) small chain
MMPWVPLQCRSRLPIAFLASIAGKQLTNRERMVLPVQDMPCQDPIERGHNMAEVALGYTEAQAKVEAARCLQCKNAPCVAGCPVAIDIPKFIGLWPRASSRHQPM